MTGLGLDAATPICEGRALEFFASWSDSFEAFSDSFELLADDCVWDQRPIPRLIGPRQARRFLRIARATLGLATCDVEILHIASVSDVVLVQRVDRLRRADGSLIAAAPVAGVLQFRSDRIHHWREHFDSAEFVVQVAATGGVHLVRRLAAAGVNVVRRERSPRLTSPS